MLLTSDHRPDEAWEGDLPRPTSPDENWGWASKLYGLTKWWVLIYWGPQWLGFLGSLFAFSSIARESRITIWRKIIFNFSGEGPQKADLILSFRKQSIPDGLEPFQQTLDDIFPLQIKLAVGNVRSIEGCEASDLVLYRPVQ